MPHPTSFNRVCCPRAVMHAMPDIADRVCCPREVMSCHAQCYQPYVLSKGGDVMPRQTSFDLLCSPRAVMSCHARRCLTVCAVQGQ